MRRITGRKPSPALLVSILALIVALGGTSYAAIKLPKNSVGNKQLKTGAVTSTKVRDGSLRLKDFKTGQVLAGAQGPAGATGATGATGPTGPKGADGTPGAAGIPNVVTRITTESRPVGDDEVLTVPCLPGEKALGGGGNIPANDPEVTIVASNPSPTTDGTTPTGWSMHFKVTGIAHNVTTSVVCAKP